MPHSFGYRARTRTLFKKEFKTKGLANTTRMLRTFKRGDYVDIKVDSSIHKGLPFKFYHGRTGVVFNVNKRAIGVTVNKQVNTRVIPKQIHVGIHHIRPSKCRDDLIARRRANEAAKAAHRAGGEFVNLKRIPKQPKEGFFLDIGAPETITPVPYVDLV